MPKNSGYLLFCRWRALDAHLAGGDLDVPHFCRLWRCDRKTVYHDLRMYPAVGAARRQGEVSPWVGVGILRMPAVVPGECSRYELDAAAPDQGQ
jgi:hypothetical protein